MGAHARCAPLLSRGRDIVARQYIRGRIMRQENVAHGGIGRYRCIPRVLWTCRLQPPVLLGAMAFAYRPKRSAPGSNIHTPPGPFRRRFRTPYYIRKSTNFVNCATVRKPPVFAIRQSKIPDARHTRRLY